MMVRCSSCKQEKDSSNFYLDKTRSNGFGSTCKVCKRTKEKIRQRLPDVSKKYVEKSRLWRKKNPLKRRAHKQVEAALNNGSLIKKNCSKCGSTRAAAHHEDYKKPLEVVWLCPLHHMERHKELNAHLR